MKDTFDLKDERVYILLQKEKPKKGYHKGCDVLHCRVALGEAIHILRDMIF
jgi:hypothetical protein